MESKVNILMVDDQPGKLLTYEAILGEVEKLASRGLSSREIARRLNAAGYRTCRASEFTAEAVRQLRSRGAALRTAG